jgi:DNA polymerase III epsilon subunit-like protein
MKRNTKYDSNIDNQIILKQTIEMTKENILEKIRDSTNLIFLDTETNGLNESYSVLSVCAIKCNFKDSELSVLETFIRYYYPIEKFSTSAIRINGLTKSKIKYLRGNANYPLYCKEDKELQHFFSNINIFIGHNIEFDLKMIPSLRNLNFTDIIRIDTMKLNTDIVRSSVLKSGSYKWPTLEETAKYYGIKSNEGLYHDSINDTKTVIEIFKAMIK